MRRNLACPLALFLVATLPALPAAADDEIHEAEAIEVIGEVEARVFEDTVNEIQLVPREEIERLPGTDGAAILDNLPGITARGRVQGEEETVSIEGLPPEFTRILVDGNRFAGEINEVDDVRDVCLENLERIEVQRGTQAIRFGPEAAGGAIDFVTRRAPRGGWRVGANVGGGSDDAAIGSSHLALGSDRVSTTLRHCFDRIGGFRTQGGAGNGVRTAAGGPDNVRRAHDVYGVTTVDASDTLRLETQYGYRRETQRFVDEEGDPARVTTEDVDRWLLGVRGDWDVGESTSIGAELDYYDLVKDTDVAREFVLDEDEWAAKIDATHFFETDGFSGDSIAHVLYAAAEFERPRLELEEPGFESSPGVQILPGGNFEEHFDVGALVAELETEWTPWLTTAVGLRTFHHSAFHNEFLPQIALRVEAHESLTLRASYGRNVRAPALRELFQPAAPQLGGAYFLAGNPELGPERTQSFRLGFEWDPVRWFTLSAVGFYNEIDDAIRSNEDPDGIRLPDLLVPASNGTPDAICRIQPELCPAPDPMDNTGVGFVLSPQVGQLFVRTNLDEVRTTGVEAYLRFRPHRVFDFQLGYTFTDSEIKAPNLESLGGIINTPRHVVDMTATFLEPRSESTLVVRARYRGEAFTENVGTGIQTFATGLKSDPSWQVDTRLVVPIPGFERANFYAEVRNLTNERVVDSFSVRGRTFFLGARIEFERMFGSPIASGALREERGGSSDREER